MNSQSPQNVSTFPVVAQILGYAGTIPFIALALSIFLDIDVAASGLMDLPHKLLVYGAVIISFIGAVHWGVALQASVARQNILFIYSVVPALAAWLWIFLATKPALFGMAATVAVMFFLDRLILTGLVPNGYLKMRLHLTIIVALCLALAAIRVG